MTLKFNNEIFSILDDLENNLGYEVMTELVDVIKDNAHVITGALKEGYKVSKTEGGASFTSDEDYWVYEEFGTYFREGHPNIVPTFNNEALLEDIISKVVRRLATRN